MARIVGTIEQEEALEKVIEKYKGSEGALMPVLQFAQDTYGYLPIEIQKKISEGLGLHLSDVYGMATFYSQFSLRPKGKHKISVCLGTACYVKGGEDIFAGLSEKLDIKSGQSTEDGKFSLEACRCIGACGLGPVITIDEDIYGCLHPGDLDGILAKY